MNFLLDTDICSTYMKGDGRIHNRFIQYGGGLSISVATLGELYTWTLRASSRSRRRQGLLDLLNDVAVLDATPEVARKFGEIEADLLDRGQTVTEFDLLIAATALVHGLHMVTHNVGDFAGIPGLNVIDWLSP